ncbi:HAD family hydrolase [Mycobacterium intracellulare]|uniref:HAD family hydrolase n=1 Tax=Mycobacterium intracellulare TaxID=1767 RepID=UPI001EEE9CAE|nr:HAD family hydrolase [Mycobacterium intracellulare]MEE3755320.1 HAD family hydrolase [Mycobacterium intracellulare]
MTARLYVCDLDGTLLRSDATLSAAARDGLNQLLDAGLAFTVATSRSAPAIRALLAGLRLTLPVIELNGAFISDLNSGHHIQQRLLDVEVADAAVRALLDSSLEPILTSWDGVEDHVYYGHGAQRNSANSWYVAEKHAYGDPRLRRHDNLAEVVGTERIATVTTFLPHSQAAALADQLSGLLGDSALVTNAPNSYVPGYSEVQVVHPQAEKGSAVMRLRDSLGLTDTTLTVFGDHLNDLPMFEVADHAIATANAHPAVLARADRVVEANDDDGVLRFLLKEHGRTGLRVPMPDDRS